MIVDECASLAYLCSPGNGEVAPLVGSLLRRDVRQIGSVGGARSKQAARWSMTARAAARVARPIGK